MVGSKQRSACQHDRTTSNHKGLVDCDPSDTRRHDTRENNPTVNLRPRNLALVSEDKAINDGCYHDSQTKGQLCAARSGIEILPRSHVFVVLESPALDCLPHPASAMEATLGCYHLASSLPSAD